LPEKWSPVFRPANASDKATFAGKAVSGFPSGKRDRQSDVCRKSSLRFSVKKTLHIGVPDQLGDARKGSGANLRKFLVIPARPCSLPGPDEPWPVRSRRRLIETVRSGSLQRELKPMGAALFTPLRIGPIETPNRIAISPMCQYSADDGTASDWHIQHVTRFAMSGAGLAVMEATGVEPEGRISPGCLGLYSEANEQALKRVLEIARTYALPGFRIGIQLCHAGRKGSTPLSWDRSSPWLPIERGGWTTLGPSAISFQDGVPPPREMTGDDIARVIAAFGAGAARAVRAGFDVVELHAAHGYLIHQFHSPLSNKRTDEWGGDPERRLRFPLAAAEAVRANTPSHVALGARITSSDFDEAGLTVDDAVRLAGELKQRGFDYVCVSSGNIVAGGRPATEPGFNIARAARVRRETGIVTRTVGHIAGPRQAEEAISSGSVDQVALGRAFLDDPNWGWHAAEVLGVDLPLPPQYMRVKPGLWPGAKDSRALAG